MSVNRGRLFATGCVLLGLIFCITSIVALAWYKKSTECFKERLPLNSFVVTITRSQQKLLIEQSRKFADKHGFNFEIVYYTPQGDDFLIEMIRKDVEVVVSNNAFHLDEFDVDFVNYDCIHPTTASDISALVDDLKSLLSEIPNVTIAEEQ